jgi:PAS domain S-box-containing protein
LKTRLQLDSIASRLTWMNLLVSAAALSLACLAFLAYDQITFRENLVRTASAQAEIVGDNTVSAVTFNDPDVARQTLAALRNSSNVRAAAIVTPDGRLFADFARTPGDRITSFPPLPPRYIEHAWYSGTNVLVGRRIQLQGKDTDTVYVLADITEILTRLWRYLLISLLVLGASLLFAYFISRGFRRWLAKPIERLASVARKISREKNFSLRADEPSASRELRVLIAAFNDMLAEIQARDSALQQMAAQSEGILQSIPQLVWTADTSGQIDFYNRRWFEYTGMTPNDDFNDWAAVVHPEDRGAVLATWKNSFDSGTPYLVEARLRRHDSAYRWHLVQAVPLRDEAGRVQQWFGTSTDIHDRKLAEAALVQAEKLALTGRMAATIAHEINNPLASITNAAHLLGVVGPANEQQGELLALLSEEVARVSHIVKSTLGLSRQTTAPGPASVPELIESVLALFQRRFHSRNVEIVKRYDLADSIEVVSSELRQVFSNIFSNALDVMPSGGRLVIAVRRSFDWSNPSRRGLRVCISDSGPGIPPEYRHRIFEAFFSTKAEMGTGLGLWVSRSIVEKHGGSIRVRSTVSGGHRGTCFSVFLPMPSASQSSSQVA